MSINLIERLRVLEHKLEDDGSYVSAETVYLAIQFVRQAMDAARTLQESDEARAAGDYCMCGEPMKGHPGTLGHSPVSMRDAWYGDEPAGEELT